MKDITIERNAVNLAALDADLRAALGAAVSGASYAQSVVTVHFTDKIDSGDVDKQVDTARRIVLNHDPAVLTPQQQKEQAQAAKLAAARQSNTADLDAAKFADPQLNEVARKVAWLEQEIIALRAGR